ncbi:MAG: universal stress protein [Rhodospirillales bacterium]|nr:universal stress protein [Rhodospirillales bacterium]MDH3790618.1 universal stress protein [Rhodospirillales bacterium]MDH3911330.1 universal stress protein [Rhodospirillales bacterium]MDH3919252.1 universal stress protein [Rhodospirillales bacterium]MDH3968232.1 universal stress protein [Rhodospirillales bacterium]
MAYKNLLVHLDDSETCAGRVAAAIVLAEAQDAYLTGLALAVETSMPTYIGGQMPVEVLEVQRAQVLERGQAVATRFDEALERSGRPGASRLVTGLDIDAARVVALHARHADLVVLGQEEPEAPPALPRHLAEDVVLSAGRPALVVPYIGAGKTLGRRVMIAWDTGREAARAVNDALPILKQAEAVTVLSVNPRPGVDLHGEEPGADIALHLTRHGVTVEVQQTQVEEINVGDTILSRLADLGCDLLVMGAYGHSRLREVVLGGVTRTMFESMTVPVLMSR